MCYHSSGFIEELMAGYAALAVLMPRLVLPFLHFFCWLIVLFEVSLITVNFMNRPIGFSFAFDFLFLVYQEL
jgi:hypothetical protein